MGGTPPRSASADLASPPAAAKNPDGCPGWGVPPLPADLRYKLKGTRLRSKRVLMLLFPIVARIVLVKVGLFLYL